MKEVLSIFSLFLVLIVNGQNWEPVSGEFTPFQESTRFFWNDPDGLLYLSGNFRYIGDSIDAKGIATWDGSQFQALPFGDTLCFSFCNAVGPMIRFQGRFLYSASRGDQSGGNKHQIEEWDGIQTSVVSEANGPINNLYIYNNDLLAIGYFDTIGGIQAHNIARWNGTQWSAFDATDFGSFISTAIEYNGELYIGGNFNAPSFREIARWDGTQWKDVGGGIVGDAWVETFAVYKGELYVGGRFHESAGNAGNFIMKWDGNEWSDVGGGVLGVSGTPSSNAQVHSLLVYNDLLYVAGTHSFAGGLLARRIATWDGQRWCSSGEEIAQRIIQLHEYQGELFASGGQVFEGDTLGWLVKWIGGEFADSCGTAVGITEEPVSRSEGFQMFPNPSNGFVQIDFNLKLHGELFIYNSLGQEVHRTAVSSGQNMLDVRKLPKGTYLVRVTTSTRSFSKRLIKTSSF